MTSLFAQKWFEVPIVVVDVETTGIIPGDDKCVQVALVRFEGGKRVASQASFIDPGRPIPAEAMAVHGIDAEKVRGAPSLDEWFSRRTTAELLKGAQPCAYQARFDRAFVPLRFFDDWEWPWLDPLTFLRVKDRYVKGSGRHRLTEACARRGIVLRNAHDALSDAEATGELLYKLIPELPQIAKATLGRLLAWQMHVEADSWEDFYSWLVKQPKKEEQLNEARDHRKPVRRRRST